MITLRYAGKLHHIPIGRAHAGKRVLTQVQDRDIRIINATTGEVLRELELDPNHNYQALGNNKA